MIKLVSFLTFLTCALAYPNWRDTLSREYRNDHAEEIAGYFEGDMILNPSQLQALTSKTRNGLISEKYRWPNNVVFYEIDPIFDESQRNYILKGFETLQGVSCIRFLPRTETTENFVYVTGNRTGCFSAVGLQKGLQILNLEPNELEVGCFRLGAIMHEFIHVLGFYHQQCASNRDDYVTVVQENIWPAYFSDFKKYPAYVVSDFGVEYDYGSVMHYGPFAFSLTGYPTIIPRDPTVEIGQRERLSYGDILKLNRMYKCPQADKK